MGLNRLFHAALPTFEERFVVPPMERETAVESLFSSLAPVSRNYPVRKGEVGVGFHTDPARGPGVAFCIRERETAVEFLFQVAGPGLGQPPDDAPKVGVYHGPVRRVPVAYIRQRSLAIAADWQE